MTNSSLKSVRDIFATLAFVSFFAGCGVSPEKEIELGKKAFSNADYKASIEHFTKAIESGFVNVDALVMLSRSQFALGKIDLALSTLKKAATTNGDDLDVIELSAQLAFYNKDYAEARKAYARIAYDSSLDPSVRSVGYAGLGVIEFVLVGLKSDEHWHRHASRVYLMRAIALDRRNASARYHLGRLYRDSFNYLEFARDQLEYYIHLDSASDPRVRKVQNEVLPALKDEIARNLAAISSSSRTNPGTCAAHLKTADVAYASKKYDVAVVNYLKALKSDPFSYQAAIGLARSQSKSAKSSQGRVASLDSYLIACRIRPTASSVLMEAAEVATSLGKLATSCELYSRALAANPLSDKAAQGLVNALHKTGDEKSVQMYSDYRKSLSTNK